MDKPKFELKKVSENKYKFVMNTKDILREETVSKQFVKEHYAELVEKRKSYLQNLSQAAAEVENNKVERDIELENFIKMADKAAAYSKMMKAEDNQKNILKLLEDTNTAMKNIENAIPELKRSKK